MQLLDASKAFDTVRYVKLFELLSDKGLCPMVARFLAIFYSCRSDRVRWDRCMSDVFDIRNDVKQGGVLFPIFLTYTLSNFYKD